MGVIMPNLDIIFNFMHFCNKKANEARNMLKPAYFAKGKQNKTHWA